MCGFCEAATLTKTCGLNAPGGLAARISARLDAWGETAAYHAKVAGPIGWFTNDVPDATPVADWLTGRSFVQGNSPADAFAATGGTHGEIANTIPGDMSTSETIAVGERRPETLEQAGDEDWFRLTLAEDQTVRVTTFGWNHDRSNGLGGLEDPVVRIYDASGVLVAENDDVIPGLLLAGSTVFKAAEAGTYFVEVDGAYADMTGDYVLSVRGTRSIFTPAPQTPLDAIAGVNTLDDRTTILVYFAEAGDAYSYSGDTFVASGTNAYEQAQLFSIFEGVEDFADIDFEITTNKTAADLQIGTAILPTESQGTLLGFFMFPNADGTGNYGLLNNNPVTLPVWNDAPGGTLDTGGFMYGVAIHEFGHAMGLAHPHDTGNASTVMTGVGNANERGLYDLNSSAYTAMSYNEGSTLAGVASNTASSGHGATFGALDIAVLQAWYGANTTHNSGNDTYALWQANGTGTASGYYTIWDTGGTDEILYEGSANAVIDLRAATLDYSEGGGGYLSYVDGVIGGYTIANGVVIEKATGGGGDDLITGNDGGNRLEGGDGANTMYGLGGDDTFVLGTGDGDNVCYGGSGSDIASYLTRASDEFDIAGSDGNWTVADTLGNTVDTLYSVEELIFSDTSLFV
ncbi:M10 family metallopeptidase C-terminal domain-containing protein [Marinibacterium profundimaris]|uniref:M10 family metallopeptidase C-terminal domain-containing protein n=1 Tax=Marinibacterium profundimaris TaxID=1679460 RepID=UPI000B52035A|nr:M10 family metallopeptidase C-terminal domain-containing protein [Marinibacterium profundimaris]